MCLIHRKKQTKWKICLNADKLQGVLHNSTCFFLLFSWAAWHFPHRQTKCSHPLVLTIMDSPHNAKSRSSNFIKGLPTSDHFPQNDTPAEHIALLTIIATCKYKTSKKIALSNEEKQWQFSPDAHSRQIRMYLWKHSSSALTVHKGSWLWRGEAFFKAQLMLNYQGYYCRIKVHKTTISRLVVYSIVLQ